MVIVHNRVSARHPELDEEDVLRAWEYSYQLRIRETDSGSRYVAVGVDSKGRELEMVAVELAGGDMLIFHAMTPPSDETYKELGLAKEGRRWNTRRQTGSR